MAAEYGFTPAIEEIAALMDGMELGIIAEESIDYIIRAIDGAAKNGNLDTANFIIKNLHIIDFMHAFNKAVEKNCENVKRLIKESKRFNLDHDANEALEVKEGSTIDQADESLLINERFEKFLNFNIFEWLNSFKGFIKNKIGL